MSNLTDRASAVTEIPAADSREAAAHFQRLLTLETDCWDVNAAITDGNAQFVLLDVRSPEMFRAGHLPGAINVPYRRINERNLAEHRPDVLFVVYCTGPHCNGADRAALKLALLDRKVKKMIGGVSGWKDEGFRLIED